MQTLHRFIAGGALALATMFASTLAAAQEEPTLESDPDREGNAERSASKEVVSVRVQTSMSGRFEVRDGRAWRFVCAVPCAADIPLGSEVRVVVNGRVSNQIVLTKAGFTDIDVNADEGSPTAYKIGLGTTAIGGAGMIPAAGATALLLFGAGLCILIKVAKSHGCSLGEVVSEVAPDVYGKPIVYGPLIGGAVLSSLGAILLLTSAPGPVTARSSQAWQTSSVAHTSYTRLPRTLNLVHVDF
jgi:hypothetical protein